MIYLISIFQYSVLNAQRRVLFYDACRDRSLVVLDWGVCSNILSFSAATRSFPIWVSNTRVGNPCGASEIALTARDTYTHISHLVKCNAANPTFAVGEPFKPFNLCRSSRCARWYIPTGHCRLCTNPSRSAHELNVNKIVGWENV